MKKISFEDALILKGARFARFLAHWLPLGFSIRLAQGVGGALYYFTKRRKVAYKNLRAAFSQEKSVKELKQIARRSVQNLAISAVELLRFPDMDLAYIQKHVRILGTEKFEPYLKERKGIIFLTAHFGNWELLNIASSLLGYPMVALTRTQKHPRSDEFLNSLRTSKGNQVIRKGMPVREILRSLKKGKIVGVLSDQDGGKNGTFVRFFNRLSSSPSGVVTFAARTGAPIFPVFIFREGLWDHRVEVEGPLSLPARTAASEDEERFLLQQFAEILESKIRKSPAEWLWAHRRWKSTPDRSVLILSDGKAGHLNQSLAVLGAFSEERESQGVPAGHTHSKVIEVKFKNGWAPVFLRACAVIFRARIPFERRLMKSVLDRKCFEDIMKSYTDVVISCGSSVLPVNLWVKKENLARNILVMKPYVSSRHFDAVVVPRHDKIKKSANIFVTTGAPSLVTQDSLQAEADRLSGEFRIPEGHRRIGLLVGGDTPGLKLDPESFGNVLKGILRYSRESGAFLFATSSRRTPRWADQLLKQTFGGEAHCPLLVIAREGNRPGVVGGILGLCDTLVVSGESISMVSEAVASGKPVIVFMPSDQAKMRLKIQRFLDEMHQEKRIIPVASKGIYEAIQRSVHQGNGQAQVHFLKEKEILRQAVKRVV